MFRLVTVAIVGISFFACSSASSQVETPQANGGEATFEGLGDLEGPVFMSGALAVSGNAAVVVGTGTSFNGPEAFRWEGGEMVGLGHLGGETLFSGATGASVDGSVVVGGSSSEEGDEAFRWEEGEMVGLGVLSDETMSLSEARGVSADGSVVVGRSASEEGIEAFRWENGELVGLGDLDGGSFLSTGNAVSADGSVVVGTSNSENGDEAFRWTAASGMVPLGGFPGGIVASFATAVSADGWVIVGTANSAAGAEAFRWENGEIVGLGDLPGGDILSRGNGVSADGSVVVGFSVSDIGQEAYFWTEAEGMQSMKRVLEEEYDLDLTGWQLLEAVDVSDNDVSHNGAAIVGYGSNPDGDIEAWRATIPTHATPTADISPDTFAFDVVVGDSDGGVLSIANLGDSELDWSFEEIAEGLIAFTHEGSGSGALDGEAFEETDFVITAIADTNNAVPVLPFMTYIPHLSSSIAIEGVGTVAFLEPTMTGAEHLGQYGAPAAIFGPLNDDNPVGVLWGPLDQVFDTWGTTTPIGPIDGPGYHLGWNAQAMATTGGVLEFDECIEDCQFDAAITAAEPVCDDVDEVAWLSVDPAGGTTVPSDSDEVAVMVNATELEPDEYAARLCITTNDPVAPLVEVLVSLTVNPDISTESDVAVEGTHQLSSVAPNPTAVEASATLEVADAQDVQAELFNASGRRMAILFEGAVASRIAQEITLDADALAPGVYLLRIVGETFSETRRITVVR